MFDLFDPKAEYVVRQGAALLHWYQPGLTYFVTFRTDDSVPLFAPLISPSSPAAC
jgi:hypothetical protein